MQQASNKKIIFLGFLSLGIFWTNIAKAVCPVCVIAVGAGLGLSEWLGIDDVVSSLWIGALLLSVILWTLTEMKKRDWDFVYDKIVIPLAYILFTFVPLYYAGILGHPLNKIWGTDKIIFGSIVGAVIFLLTHWLNLYIKEKNNYKPLFPYQKVVFPVVALFIASLVFYFLVV